MISAPLEEDTELLRPGELARKPSPRVWESPLMNTDPTKCNELKRIHVLNLKD